MMKKLQVWLAAKGGVVHVLAGAYISLVAAYASVPQFHALVQYVHAALPAWAQEVFSTALALIAFYKQPNKQTVVSSE